MRMKTSLTIATALFVLAALAVPVQALPRYCSTCSCQTSCDATCIIDEPTKEAVQEYITTTCGAWGFCRCSPSCTTYGTSGDDIMYGSDNIDSINGRGGDDFIYGLDANDCLYGEDGNDYLYGGSDNDILSGGSGSDHLDGGSGTDTCSSGEVYYSCEY